jgi:hypothetical protein
MSRRYSGPFSRGAEGSPPAPVARPASRLDPPPRIGFWARAMMYAPAPLLFAALGDMRSGAVFDMVVELGALALLLLAGWLLREGVRAEIEYDRRPTARRPAIPRKIFASALTGAGVALAGAFAWDGAGLGIIPGVGLGLVAALAHAFAFGPDPLTNKGMEKVDVRALDRAAEAVDKAEAALRETLDAAARLSDRRLRSRVESLCGAAREVLRQIEADPRDLGRARRFLSVQVVGVRDATVRYAKLGVQDPALRQGFDSLLTQLETSFQHQRARLLDDDREALEVEIEVLKDRLQQEGLGQPPAR